MTPDRESLIALLKERSLELGEFTLSSGKTSSYYVDARRTTMSAAGLRLIGKLGCETISAAGWAAAQVGGLTLGADPVAYAIARASLDMPPTLDAFTVRKAPKDHGAGRLVEGCYNPAFPAVLVEDVITTGGSALRAAEAVVRKGGSIAGVLAVVDREEGGREAIEEAGYEVRTLVSIRDLGVVPQPH